jgi:hypothetical protein
MSATDKPWNTVTVEIDGRIAWVTLNRPEKRNAMNPQLNAEMIEVLEAVEADEQCGVMVLTGAGDSWSAGMDLQEYFREVDEVPEAVQLKVGVSILSDEWRRCRLWKISKYPKIALANSTRVIQRFRSSSSTCIRLQKDSMTALSKQSPTEPIDGSNPRIHGSPRERPRGELGSLVTVNDGPAVRPALVKGHSERVGDQRGARSRVDGPTHHAA